MQAVSETEKQAQQLVRTAKENGEQIISEAASQAAGLIADAVKEARKRADVLRGVARADAGKKLRARSCCRYGKKRPPHSGSGLTAAAWKHRRRS